MGPYLSIRTTQFVSAEVDLHLCRRASLHPCLAKTDRGSVLMTPKTLSQVTAQVTFLTIVGASCQVRDIVPSLRSMKLVLGEGVGSESAIQSVKLRRAIPAIQPCHL